MTDDKQLQNWINSAPVVVFRSPVTEMDALRRALKNRNITFREIELSMAFDESREQFHQLKKLTNYQLLPQVFINSSFTGGGDKSLHSDALEALSATNSPVSATKKLVLALGYAGIIPFIFFTLLAFLSESHAWAIRANTAYGAVILTFIGAIHWGRLLQMFSSDLTRKDAGVLVVSVLPSLLAWVVLIDFFNPASSLCILISGFMAMCAFEGSLKSYTSAWYRRMRMQLGYTVSALLALSVLSILLVG
jgi:glutaredoxin-related protein